MEVQVYFKKEVEQFKKELIAQLKTIPDQDIQRVGKGFIISSTKLSKDLVSSPSYYDNSYQVEVLTEIISRAKSIDGLVQELKHIARTGKTHISRYKDMRFNNDVREHISNLL